jgi:hypothetical protein
MDQHAIALPGFSSALEDHSIAGAKGEPTDLDDSIGSALEDDEEDSDWTHHPTKDQAIVEGGLTEDLTDRIGLCGECAQPIGEGSELIEAQGEPGQQRGGQVLLSRCLQVLRIGFQDLGLPLVQDLGQVAQGLAALCVCGGGQDALALTGALGELGKGIHQQGSRTR